MRIEYRWIDYLVIFSDSRYEYYYEIIDNLTREEILSIEYEVIEIYRERRNKLFQTEYFYCDKIEEFNETVIKILEKNRIKYIVYDKHNFERINYDNKPETFELKENPIILKPYNYQLEILDKIEDYYKNNDSGCIFWSCGLGKALLGILIVKKLEYKTVVIGVPSIYLQKQMKNEIMRIYNNSKNILYIGGETETNNNYIIKSVSNNYNTEIKDFINQNNDCKFLITTYDSCYKLLNYSFDFKIADEAHHLVGSSLEITKHSFHNIQSKKQLFMTATKKIITDNNNENENINYNEENEENRKRIYCMRDKGIFGEIIDVKSINWAIENKKITDYNIVIIKNTENEIDNIINNINIKDEEMKKIISNNKELFLSAYMSLKSIENYEDLTHLLIYTNKTENAEYVNNFISVILDLEILNINKDNYYNKALHSNIKDVNIEDELTKFKKSSWGIISSVYIFSEGFDCPRLNGIVFGENMDSDIRIVQSTLRPNRLDKEKPDKKAYVIIPYMERNDITEDNKSFDKCVKIISKIRNEDETIEHKINVVLLNKNNKERKKEKEGNKGYKNFIENGDELKKIILKLKKSKALLSKSTEEEDEYNYVKLLNKELEIKSREEYISQEIKNKHKEYKEDPEEYFKKKGVWTNWNDYLGIKTDNFIQDKEKWIKFCKNINVKSIEDYKEKCKIYKELPINPDEYYKEFSNIPNELKIKNNNNKRR